MDAMPLERKSRSTTNSAMMLLSYVEVFMAVTPAVVGWLVPERGTFDTGCKQRRFALVMGDRRRLALRAKLIEGYPLAGKECQHLLGCIRPDPVREFAFSLAEVLNAQLPRHVNARPPGRSENVGVRVEDQMIFVAKRLDKMLHHQATADDLDVDGHAFAVRRHRRSCGNVRWRTALVLFFRKAETPRRNVDLFDWRVDSRRKARVDDLILIHVGTLLVCGRDPYQPAASRIRFAIASGCDISDT